MPKVKAINSLLLYGRDKRSPNKAQVTASPPLHAPLMSRLAETEARRLQLIQRRSAFPDRLKDQRDNGCIDGGHVCGCRGTYGRAELLPRKAMFRELVKVRAAPWDRRKV